MNLYGSLFNFAGYPAGFPVIFSTGIRYSAGFPVIFSIRYPASQIWNQAVNRLSNKAGLSAGYPAGWISGASL
jgi:hypothetical protein